MNQYVEQTTRTVCGGGQNVLRRPARAASSAHNSTRLLIQLVRTVLNNYKCYTCGLLALIGNEIAARRVTNVTRVIANLQLRYI